MANRAGSSSRRVPRASDVDFDAVPSPRPRKSFASSLRRSSIGLPLRPSNSPLDVGSDVPPFDDGRFLDGDDDAEPESPGRFSRQLLKGKAKVTNEDPDREGVGEEIAQGLEDIEMNQRDEDEEVTPKKIPTKKRPRKKRALPEIPCKSPFSLT